MATLNSRRRRKGAAVHSESVSEVASNVLTTFRAADNVLVRTRQTSTSELATPSMDLSESKIYTQASRTPIARAAVPEVDHSRLRTLLLEFVQRSVRR